MQTRMNNGQLAFNRPCGPGSAHGLFDGTCPTAATVCTFARSIGDRERGGANRAITGGCPPRHNRDRTERALARLLQGHGFAAARVPLSGAAGGRFSGDIMIPAIAKVARTAA